MGQPPIRGYYGTIWIDFPPEEYPHGACGAMKAIEPSDPRYAELDKIAIDQDDWIRIQEERRRNPSPATLRVRARAQELLRQRREADRRLG